MASSPPKLDAPPRKPRLVSSPPSGAIAEADTGGESPPAPPPAAEGTATRLLSLDAYRGLIMAMLAASGFGIAKFASLPPESPIWQRHSREFWQRLAFHFDHPAWTSQFSWVGVSFWDLIQPAFMFMVGVALPYSYARRQHLGHSQVRQVVHASWRALVLVLMGVFLSSQQTETTNWTFVNVLTQIGLGYVFLFLLAGTTWRTQVIVLAAILVGYWALFAWYRAPADYDFAAVEAVEGTVFTGWFAPWSKNANVGHHVDLWFLNLFHQPQGPFLFNRGGYVTLNFIPSIGTMLLGLMCGRLLRSELTPSAKFGRMMLGGAVCMALGVLAGATVCPIVKRIWTPSWVLFSGAWVIWGLAMFYLVFDICRGTRWLAFPLVIVGMNSIVMYLAGQLLRPWTIRSIRTNLGGLLDGIAGPQLLDPDGYGRLAEPTLAFLAFWLFALWMYRQKMFVRV